MSGPKQYGKVYLLGGGTGDIELLTLKGARVLKCADIIIYDRLVNPLFLYLAKPSAVFIYCGKLPQAHTLTQSEIQDQMVGYAKEGQTVVRLKGGDPAIFGRVAEEIASLDQEGIAYEVIPGVTAASVASIYAGIPLTCRGMNEHVTLATAHRQADVELPLDFAALAKGGTLAFYMGMANLPVISQQLVAHGVASQTPIAVISWGSYGRQQVVSGTLTTIVEQVASSQLVNPAMIIVGEVVTCRQKKSWFEQLPDFGRRLLLVSQRKIQWEELAEFTARGADVWLFQVGAAYEPRMAEATSRMLTEERWDEVVYLDQEVTTKQLLREVLSELALLEKVENII